MVAANPERYPVHVLLRSNLHLHALLVAVSALSLNANAGKLPDFKQIGASTSGRSVTLGPTGQGAAWGSSIPINPPGPGGFQTAGNYGVPLGAATGPTMTMTGNGNVFFAGTKYPFQAGYQLTKGDILNGVIGLASAFGGWGFLAAAGGMAIKAWMDNAGVSVNPNATGAADQFLRAELPPDGNPNTYAISGAVPIFGQSVVSGCQSTAAYAAYGGCKYSIYQFAAGVATGSSCGGVARFGPGYCHVLQRADSGFGFNHYSSQWRTTGGTRGVLPASMDDIAPYMRDASMPSRVVQDVLDQGGSINMPQPTISGPSSLDGGTKETTHPDGSRTVERVTYNFTTNDNRITYNNQTTTTTTYNSANVQTGQTTTTETPSDNEAEESECTKNPGSLACQELGEVEPGDLSGREVPLTFAPVSFTTNATCPQPVEVPWSVDMGVYTYASAITLGYEPVCDALTTWIRPIVLLMAAVVAVYIFTDGFKV